MTSRHTISHADELYAGDAFLQGQVSTSTTVSGVTVGSPDGRRGIPMSHIFVREYGAVVAADPNGIIAGQVVCDLAVTTNLLTKTDYASGALVTTVNGGTVILDMPRNIRWSSAKNDAAVKLHLVGRDEYGQLMAENISGPNNSTVAGVKAFKTIHDIQVSAATVSKITVGTGAVLGLPYHLSSKGRFLSYMVDGMTPSGGATEVTLVSGLALTTDATTSHGDPDVRGTFAPVVAPDASKVFTAVMLVDHSSRDSAYGKEQATVIT